MKVLTRDAVAQIKAAEGVYRAADVARNYEVHRSTITRIWGRQIHADVSPADDFPDIAARYRASDKAEDLNILINRGMSIDEAAQALDISRSAAYLLRGLFM